MTKKVWVYDLEQMFNFHCATFLNRDNPIELQQFVIHKSRNDFNEYIEFLETQVGGLIGFNNLNYDYPLIHYLLEEKDYFYSNNAESTANKLYSRSQIIINSEYSEIPSWKTLIPQLDLYRINHFDNAAKRTSLKAIEIAIGFHNVSDLPFKFDHYVQDNEVQKILDYNLNDVLATYEFYKLNIGEIEMRKKMSKEYSINLLNANEPKIGSEIFAKLLSEEMGVNIRDLKQMRTYRNSIKLNECILPYIKFNSKEFNNILNNYKNKIVIETKNSLEESVIYKGFKFDFGLGGLHGCIKPGKYSPNEDEVIHDIDVASFYPNIAIINKFKPKHLGEAFTTIYNKMYHERKSAPKGSAKNGGLKLALNGSFGKSNDIYSFFYDPMFTMQITVNGQLLLSMLAEEILDNIECIFLQANTDGITLKYNKKYTEKVESIMKWWEELTGLQLESAYYNLMVIRDVNNYLARDIKGKAKYKGAFEIIPMANGKVVYWKDSSMKIVPIAISEYFLNNKPIKETIKNHTNIYDFCKRFKSTEGWVTEARNIDYDVENLPYQKVEKQQKNIRYYISNKGSTLMKVHKDRRESNIEKGWQCTIMNKYIDLPIKDYDINYSYYIAECNKIIDIIEDKQLTLF
jgi:hypothetical protein